MMRPRGRDGAADRKQEDPAMRRLVILTAIAAVFSLALTGPALAAKPVPFSEAINESFVVDDVCPFPFTQTLTGTVRGKTFVDGAGNPVREIGRVHLDGTFAANGVVVPFIVRQGFNVTFNDDGSVTVAITGVVGRVVVKGQGLVGATIGRVVLTFPADGGEPTVDFEAGQNNEAEFFGPILCGLLAP